MRPSLLLRSPMRLLPILVLACQAGMNLAAQATEAQATEMVLSGPGRDENLYKATKNN